LLLKADMSELNKSVLDLKDGLQKQLSDQLGASNKQLASANRRPVSESCKKSPKSSPSWRAPTKTSVISPPSSRACRTCLQNPKQRGVLGEYYLEQILKNVLPPGAYQLQYKLADGLIVDAAIILDDKVLPSRQQVLAGEL
jgi:DNA recombination protein RmuC